MIKKFKFLCLFLIFITLANCSFDKKTGFWSGSEEEKRRVSELTKKQNEISEVVNIYSSNEAKLSEVQPTKIANLNKPVENFSWKMSGLNLQNNTGNIYFSGLNKIFLKKKIGKNKFDISKIKSSPVIDDSTNIFFADDTGTIYCINQYGKLKWKKNIYTKVYKRIYKNLTFSLYNNKIYISDNIGFIYAMNSEDGNLVWIKNHSIPLKSRIKVFKNKIFLINQDNRIICLDSETGSKIWDIRAISSFIKTQNYLSLAISNDMSVIALSSSGDLLKINSETGNIYWSLNVSSTVSAVETDFFKSSDIVTYKNEIFFSATSSFFSINSSTGSINWEKNISTTNTPIIDGNNVFLVSNSGYFLNLNKDTGDIIWSINILKILKKKHQKTEITGFVLGSGKIYSTTLNGYIITSSAESGKTESFRKIASLVSAAPIISGGSLYVLTEKPSIIGFN